MKSKNGWKAFAVLILAVVFAGALTFYLMDRGDPERWLEDFQVLKQGLSEAYANLEWAAEYSAVDVHELGQKTEQALSKTSSRGQARRIINDFLKSFNDPHLSAVVAERPKSRQGTEESFLTATTDIEEALNYMGFRSTSHGFKLNFADIAGFEEIGEAGNPFPAIIVSLPGNRTLGVIRIADFGPDRYYDIAKELWADFRSGIEEVCDNECQYAFEKKVGYRLLDLLQARIEQCESAGIDALAIDITRNGGGTEWSEAVARLFTPIKLRCTPGSFIKHDHWVRRLERELGWIETDLAKTGLSAQAREILTEGHRRLNKLLNEAREDCDRSILWEQPNQRPDCSLLIEEEYTCGVFDYLDNEEITRMKSGGALSSLAYAPFQEGAYSGPLFVITDKGSASAAEGFASLLQFNKAAILVGEKTYGAGCGYTDGGVQTYLENLGLSVQMSDCVRYRADGENELAGIEPDILVNWEKGDSETERAEKLIAAISRFSF